MSIADSMTMRGYHDIGGLPLGAIDRAQHDYALWEKRVDAMLVLLSSKGTRFRCTTCGSRCVDVQVSGDG